VKPKKFIVFLRGIEPVTDVIFLKWSLRNLNKIQSSKYSRTLSGNTKVFKPFRFVFAQYNFMNIVVLKLKLTSICE